MARWLWALAALVGTLAASPAFAISRTRCSRYTVECFSFSFSHPLAPVAGVLLVVGAVSFVIGALGFARVARGRTLPIQLNEVWADPTTPRWTRPAILWGIAGFFGSGLAIAILFLIISWTN